MATAIVKPDTLDAADTLFDDLTDLRAMLICVTGEGMQGLPICWKGCTKSWKPQRWKAER